jgi:colicin import membrane protein
MTTAKHGVSEAELALLSDEERAALEAGETGDAADRENLAEIAGEGGADADAGGEDGPGDGEDDDEDATQKAAREKEEATDAAAAKAARTAELEAMSDEERANAEAADKAQDEAAARATAKAKAEADAKAAAEGKAAAGEDEDEDDDAPLTARMPRYKVEPVEKYAEKSTALDAEYAEAFKSFKAGDMELDALHAKQREIESKRSDLREAKLKAEMATSFNDQMGVAEWQNDVAAFFDKVKKSEGIDYNKPSLNAAVDYQLKALAADEANKDKSPQWFLRTAHKLVKADLGIVAKPAADDKGDDKGKPADKTKPAGRKPALAMVKTLSGLPNAGDDDAAGGDSEFTALDKLSGLEFEDALARMPQAKQDRYLRRA